MSDVKKVLVGVDLLQAVQAGESRFSPPVEQAITQALWLGGKAGAEVTFLAAVETAETELQASIAGEELAKRIEDFGETALRELVERAGQAGVKAQSRLVSGKGWVELTHEAVRGAYDLAIVGTRGMGAVGQFLFGSTAMKLLHNCPAPVWVAKPAAQPAPQRLLVASDLSSVSDAALRLAIQIGSLAGASVDLVHVFVSPFARLWDAGLLEARQEEKHHARALADARTRLEQQVARAAGGQAPAHVKPEVIEGVGHADVYLLELVKNRQIDLLVMGTMARGGIPGVFIGNTAERLLVQAGCSMLAVKPTDFKCPI
jgi:nucleotide-binding universal stress UspA family protein